MSLGLALRLVLAALFGALLVITLGVALQLRELAVLTEDVLGPNVRLLAAAAEMQRLLGEAERGPAFEEAFAEQLGQLDQAQTTGDEREPVAGVVEAFAAYVQAEATADDTLMRSAVAELSAVAGEQAKRTTAAVGSDATTSAIGLGIVGAVLLVLGVWMSRAAQVRIFDRLARIERTAAAIAAGDVSLRVGDRGTDELARVAAALDLVLDLRDRGEAAILGRNRELRALLVALLREWPHPVAVAGIDGEILVSTLTPDEDEAFGSITPQLRKATRTLLSRRFLSPADLATEIRTDSRHRVRVRALTVGGQRMVGWFVRVQAEADASQEG